MFGRGTWLRAGLLTGGVAASALLVGVPAASAAPAPASSCPTPTISVRPASGAAGSRVVVSGQHFSGCPARGSSARPTRVLTVGVAFAEKTSGSTARESVLGTTRTTSAGSFSITVTIPSSARAGRSAIAAASRDSATGLSYAATRPFVVTGSSHTTTASGSGSGTTPTHVNAGSGGLADSSSPSGVELGLIGVAGLAGLGLTGAGARRLARR